MKSKSEVRARLDARWRKALEFAKYYDKLIKKYGSLKYCSDSEWKKLKKLGGGEG